MFASGVIDGCDGEIARLKLQYSPIGAWLDTIVDELTSFTYFLAIGYHTYTHYSEGWLASSIAVGAVCYAATVYGIYYFCVVVLKAGGSQYYVGKLDIVDGASGLALRAAPEARAVGAGHVDHVRDPPRLREPRRARAHRVQRVRDHLLGHPRRRRWSAR